MLVCSDSLMPYARLQRPDFSMALWKVVFLEGFFFFLRLSFGVDCLPVAQFWSASLMLTWPVRNSVRGHGLTRPVGTHDAAKGVLWRCKTRPWACHHDVAKGWQTRPVGNHVRFFSCSNGREAVWMLG